MPNAEGGSRLDTAAGDLFATLATMPALVLAVSGGPDSMALLHLVTSWARAIGAGAPMVHVVTVDHGLRPESRAEAALVASAAAGLGVSHAILTWDGDKPSTRIQERARAARYALLGGHARAVGAAAILTAHHANDQAETVLLRLGRGSGIGGLAGMARESPLVPGVALVRPLLGLPKADLVAFCRTVGQVYVEDPSNGDAAFARARLRAQAGSLAALGLDAPGLARFARRMARADAALEKAAARLEACLAPDIRDGHYRASLEPARGAGTELLLRVLRRAIARVAPERATISLERLETLTAAIEDALDCGAPHRATLAGARVVLARDTMIEVTREGPRHRGRTASDGKTTVSPSLRPNCRVS